MQRTRLRALAAILAAAVSQAAAAAPQPQTAAQIAAAMQTFRTLPRPPECHGPRVLVVYDGNGPKAAQNQLAAVMAGNLAGGYGSAEIVAAADYKPGMVAHFSETIILGSADKNAFSKDLLGDLAADTRPLVWAGDGLGQLAAARPDFADHYGFLPASPDTGEFREVEYRGQPFERSYSGSGLNTFRIADAGRMDVLATALRSDGARIPWALHAANLTYIGEDPLPSAAAGGAYEIFADLIGRSLDHTSADHNQALLRISRVGPDSDPKVLQAIADHLASRHLPYMVSVYDVFADPLNADPVHPAWVPLKTAPQVVTVLKFMQSHGATLVMSGHTHQYIDQRNPFDGKSGDDAEFFRAHLAGKQVVWDGPVGDDSLAWAYGRLDAGTAEWAVAGLDRPALFSFPLGMASALDQAAVAQRFAARIGRGVYFAGTLAPVPADQVRYAAQSFPWPVQDIYGGLVIPQTMGQLGSDALDLERLKARAAELKVIKGAIASIAVPWDTPMPRLDAAVGALQAEGWHFVSVRNIVDAHRCR